MTSLEMVYTRDGILTLLKQQRCPRENWQGHGHSNCHCDRQHQIHTVKAVHVPTADEVGWVWHRCPTRHQADV